MMEETPSLEPPVLPPTFKMGTPQNPGAHLTHQAHHREGCGVPDMERVYQLAHASSASNGQYS